MQLVAPPRLLGDTGTRRVPIPRLSIRGASSHFAPNPVVPTKARQLGSKREISLARLGRFHKPCQNPTYNPLRANHARPAFRPFIKHLFVEQARIHEDAGAGVQKAQGKTQTKSLAGAFAGKPICHATGHGRTHAERTMNFDEVVGEIV